MTCQRVGSNRAFYFKILFLFQVKSGTIFDNILVTDSVEYAEQFAKETFEKTKEGEKKMKDEQDEKERKEREEEEKKRKEEEDKKKAEEEDEEDEEEEEVCLIIKMKWSGKILEQLKIIPFFIIIKL